MYGWVNTCCIDKSSSAELSEAINSMFLWYKNAELCYAYLVDITGTDPENREFAASRWYTRGWTLQELLAPKTVIFIAKDWRVIGSKEKLVYTISAITKIHVGAFEGANINDFSVAQRISWASRRVTTRVEDTAYCLLGIFNVNIPLLYGEGLKSFRRLQEEIIKNSADQSIFAWVSKKGFLDNISISLCGMFTGSPSCFTESGNIMAFWEKDISDPYSMTDKGLHIHFPTLTSTNSTGVIIILAYCFQDNPVGPIGVRLVPGDFVGDKERYGRVWTGIPEGEGFHFGVRSYESNPGLLVIPLKQAIHAVRKPMFIRHKVLGGYPNYRADLLPGHTFLVSELPSRDYRLSDVYPPESWNKNQQLLSLTNNYASPKSNSQHAVMLFRPNRLELNGFIVALGHLIHFIDRGPKVWCDVRKDGPDVSLKDIWL
jgi:hypothetical protein